MTHINRQFLALLVLLCGACAPQGGASDEPNECLNLTQPEGTSWSASLPAKVTASFRLETCKGQAVPRLSADAFTVSEDGVALDPNESRHAVLPHGESWQIDSVLLLDLSGSILRSGSVPALQTAARAYLDAVLAQQTSVAVWTFDGRAQPQIVADFGASADQLHAAIDSLSTVQCQADADCAGVPGAATCAAFRCVDDSTNLYGAVDAALDALDARHSTADFHNSALVAFTDGADEAARVSLADAQSKVATSPSHVFTVGLGPSVDENALTSLGKDGFFRASDTMQLASAFTNVADQVESLAGRDYELVYCSPKRSGMHQVSILASWHGLEGRLDGQIDATGFASGCSF
jgi:hypothetical protein